MKGDIVEHQAEDVRAPQKLQYADEASLNVGNFDPLDATRYSKASGDRYIEHTGPTKGAAVVLPLVSVDGSNDSIGGAVTKSATSTEQHRDVCVGAAMGTPGASRVSEERGPVLCAVKMWKSSASALDPGGRPTVSSSTISTTPAEDWTEASRISLLPTAHLTSQQVVRDCATRRQQQTREQPRRFSQDGVAEIRGKCLFEVEEKKHALVDVHNTQSQQHMSHDEGQLTKPGKTISDKRGNVNYLSADEKMERNEQKITAGSYASLCPIRRKSNSSLRDGAEVLPVDTVGGHFSQSSRMEVVSPGKGDFLTEIAPVQLQQCRRASAEIAPASCRGVEGSLYQTKTKSVSGNNSPRLPELRQFTLELLYAVSFLRPFGRRGSPRHDSADTFTSHGEPAANQQERVNVFTSAQLSPHSKYTHGEREKGHTDSAAQAELQEASRDCQEIRSSDPSTVPFRRCEGYSSLHDVAALKRRVTEAVLLCKKGEGIVGVHFTATDSDKKRNVAEGRETGRSDEEEERRAGEVTVADAALAAVASVAVGLVQYSSFEAIAEKVSAAKTLNEVATYLCGYFGPLLHLLQEHMNQNRVQQHSRKPTTGNKSKSNIAVSADDSGVSEVGVQALAQDRHFDLDPPERRVLLRGGKHVDETVQGVNAILQVLTEVDQSVADATLDSVCKRLFPPCHDENLPSSSPLLHSRSSGMSGELVRQAEDRKPWRNRGQQQQQTDELTRVEYRPLSNANVARSGAEAASSGRPERERGVLLYGDLYERRAEWQSRIRDDDEDTEYHNPTANDTLSPFLTAGDEHEHFGTGKNHKDTEESDAREIEQVGGDQKQASTGGGIIFSAARNVEAFVSNGSPLYAQQCYVDSDVSSSSSTSNVTIPVVAHPPPPPQHRVDNNTSAAPAAARAAQRFPGSRRAPECARDVTTQALQSFSVLHEQHQQEKMQHRGEMEDRTNVDGGSNECDDESLSRRTAWLAAQLSTPLDCLGGDTMRDTDDVGKKEKESEKVMHILDTLEATVLQPLAASSRTTSPRATAAAVCEKVPVMTERPSVSSSVDDEDPREWETGVQIVLRMLCEQEEKLPASESASAPAADHGGVLPGRERHAKRRVVFDDKAEQAAVHQRILTEENQLRNTFMSGSPRDGDNNAQTQEKRAERATALRAVLAAESAFNVGRGMVEGDYASSLSKSNEETRGTTADDQAAALFKRIAAAAAVERAATAVAQQGAVAALEHARIGSPELIDKIPALQGQTAAELSKPTTSATPTPATTELAASTCLALRRAVEHVVVEHLKDDEETVAAEDNKDMFAELDDEGLDKLVSRLLKLAERPIEHHRRPEIRQEQLMVLLHDMHGSGEQQENTHGILGEHDGSHLHGHQPSHVTRSQRPDVYQQYLQQQQQNPPQWKDTSLRAEGQIVRRRGTGGADGIDDVSRHLLHRETSVRRTNPVSLENSTTTSEWAQQQQSPRSPSLHGEKEIMASYLRTTEILHREEKLVPLPRVSSALITSPKISTVPIRPLPRRLSSSSSSSSSFSRNRRHSLNVPGSASGISFSSSPADSPSLIPRRGRYCVLDTPTTPPSDAPSFGPSRQTNVKRSPWRSCEPYSSSASTMVASPIAATGSAKSFGSSSSSLLPSSPFPLLPTSATSALQPFGITSEDSRSESTWDAATSRRPSRDIMVRGGGGGFVGQAAAEASAGDSSTILLRDPYLHRDSSSSSSRLTDSRHRRLSSEGGVNLFFDNLPARVSGADFCPTSTLSVYSATTATTSRRTTEAKTALGESVTGKEGAQHRDVTAAEALQAQLRALDFFDISASARAHLLSSEVGSPSAPVLRALSSLAGAASSSHEVNTIGERRQERHTTRIVRTQTAEGAKVAHEDSAKVFSSRAVPGSQFSREEESQGGLEPASPMKLEHAHLLSPRPFSSIVGRSTSPPGSPIVPAIVLQPSALSKSSFHERTSFNIGTLPVSAEEKSRSERDDQQLEMASSRDRTALLTRGDGTMTTTTGVQRGDQQQQDDPITSMLALGHSWTRTNAGCSGRIGRQQQQQRQQQMHLGGKDLWLQGSGLVVGKGDSLRRSRGSGGEERQDERSSSSSSSSSSRQYESLQFSPHFTRITPTSGRKEAAVAGCVGTGGPDCRCGGTLCLYRSAVSGVVYDKSGQKWTARWNEDGRQHKRTFAAAKYGFLTAKMKAEACRGEARERNARSKHEALQRQQDSLAQRLGLFCTARPVRSTSSQSHDTCANPFDSSTTLVTQTVVEERKQVQRP